MSAAHLHVTLKHPISIKVMGKITSFKVFDGFCVPDASPEVGPQNLVCYRTVRLYATAEPIAMKIALWIHADNIAGYVSQPSEIKAAP